MMNLNKILSASLITVSVFASVMIAHLLNNQNIQADIFLTPQTSFNCDAPNSITTHIVQDGENVERIALVCLKENGDLKFQDVLRKVGEISIRENKMSKILQAMRK